MGPLNGGVPWPKGFDAERRREKEWLSYVRGAYKLLPGRGATLAASSAILAGSRHTASEIPARCQDRVFWLPENAIDPDRFYRVATPGRDDGLLRCAFVGRLVPYKGCDMLIEAALPLLGSGRVVLDIVGDGPMMAQLQAQARAAGIPIALSDDAGPAAIRFHGWLERRQVQDVLAKADLFTFPSVREFGGGVVLEAMALGVPPLIVDYAGPGELVGPGLGYKIPIGSRSGIVLALGAELKRIAEDRSELAQTGARARKQALAAYTWEAKARQISCIYNWVLAGSIPPGPNVMNSDPPLLSKVADDQAVVR